MASWRFWPVLLCLAFVVAQACSGQSKKEPVHEGGGAGEVGTASGGTSLGAAGEPGVGGGDSTSSVSSAGGVTSTGFTSTGFTVTTTTGMSATGGTIIPGAWRCTVLAYGDGLCDCGCGAPDPDCSTHEDIGLCGRCDSYGSCSNQGCPGKIEPSDTTLCKQIPQEWTCSDAFYDDGEVCHCGCGALDPDCDDEGVEACDVCNAAAACSRGTCPSAVAEDENWRCDVPPEWECFAGYYGDDTCHCGCGIVDIDCASASRTDCVVCSSGCSDEVCPGPIDAEDNSICTGPPRTWNCDDRFYRDGSLCHCGCGALDPDCTSAELAACDACDMEGSCSAQPCPGTIDADDNAHCEHPPPPEGWTCSSFAYADGSTCDCGCGAPDLDCVDNDIDTCENCYGCDGYNCWARLDPEDPTQCFLPPEAWHCDEWLYLDGYSCDCGCGAVDPDCESERGSICEYCRPYAGSCANDYNCSNIDPTNNARCDDDPPEEWTCNPDYYGDKACDCGCGVRDLDCASGDVGECDFCDAPGSCSTSVCPGTIDETDNAVCAPD